MNREEQLQTSENLADSIREEYDKKNRKLSNVIFLAAGISLIAAVGTLIYSLSNLQEEPLVVRHHAKASETRDALKYRITHFQGDTLSYRPVSLDSNLAYIFDSKHRSLGDLEEATALVEKDLLAMEEDVAFKAWKLYDPEKQHWLMIGKVLFSFLLPYLPIAGFCVWKERRYVKEKVEKLKRIGV